MTARYRISFFATQNPFAVERNASGKCWAFVCDYPTLDEAETAIARLAEAETILPRYYDSNSARLEGEE